MAVIGVISLMTCAVSVSRPGGIVDTSLRLRIDVTGEWQNHPFVEIVPQYVFQTGDVRVTSETGLLMVRKFVYREGQDGGLGSMEFVNLGVIERLVLSGNKVQEIRFPVLMHAGPMTFEKSPLLQTIHFGGLVSFEKLEIIDNTPLLETIDLGTQLVEFTSIEITSCKGNAVAQSILKSLMSSQGLPRSLQGKSVQISCIEQTCDLECTGYKDLLEHRGMTIIITG